MGLFSRKSKKEKEDFNQKKIKKSFKMEEIENEEKKIEKKEDKNKYQDNKKGVDLVKLYDGMNEKNNFGENLINYSPKMVNILQNMQKFINNSTNDYNKELIQKHVNKLAS